MLYLRSNQYSPVHACKKCQLGPAFPFASGSLDKESERPGIDEPRMQIKLSQVIWLCERCWLGMLDEVVRVTIQYAHARIRPGLNGKVSEQIREISPDHLLAGKLIRTCIGYYSPLSDSYTDESDVLNHHIHRVPVHLQTENNTMVRLVPEKYILID